jgi:hypothetical protein
VTAGARRAPRTDLSGARHGGCTGRPSSTALVVSSLGVLSVLPAIFGWRRNQTSSTFLSRSARIAQYLHCRTSVPIMRKPEREKPSCLWDAYAASAHWRVPRVPGRGRAIQGLTLNTRQAGKWRVFFLLTKIIGISGSGANIARSAECDRGQRDSALAVFQGNFELSKGVKNQNEIGCWHSASKHVRGADFDELPSGLTSASSVEPSSGSKTVELRPSAWPSRWRAWACS